MTEGAVRRLSSASLRRTIHNLVPRSRTARLKAWGALAVLLALGCWALASPVGASPDEDFHLGSIWCAQGIEAGRCEQGPTAQSRLVPADVARATCYAFKPETSAACQTNPPVP